MFSILFSKKKIICLFFFLYLVSNLLYLYIHFVNCFIDKLYYIYIINKNKFLDDKLFKNNQIKNNNERNNYLLNDIFLFNFWLVINDRIFHFHFYVIFFLELYCKYFSFLKDFVNTYFYKKVFLNKVKKNSCWVNFY